MTDNTVSSEIYQSRDATRDKIIELLQRYLELGNVDLTKTSFLSYVTDVMSILSSNLMFYQGNVYREFFMTKAQLPESIYNLSSFIGYTPSEASYSSTNLLITVPLPFNDTNITFSIADGRDGNFKFQTSDGIKFLTYYTTTVTVINNSDVTIQIDQDGKLYTLPVYIDTTSADQQFQFVLPVRQYKSTRSEFIIDPDLQPNQFTNIDVPIDGKVAEMSVYVRNPGSDVDTLGMLYDGSFDSLYLMTSSDYGYVSRNISEGKRLYFGNGVIGQQPLPGSTVIVFTDITEGESGNVIAGSVTTGSRIYTMAGGASTIVNYTVTNTSPATGGSDEESLQEIKQNSIDSLTSLNRLVSEGDYGHVKTIIEDAPIAENSIAVLKRSDLKVNEIQLFTILNFNNEIVPTRNIYYSVPTGTTVIPRDTVITFDGVEYITIFDIEISSLNTYADYEYNLLQLQITPLLIQSWSSANQDAYNFNSNELLVSYNDASATVTFEFSYFSDEIDRTNCSCDLTILSTDDTRAMTNTANANGGVFSYTFPNYTDIPKGSQTYYLTVSNSNLPIQQLISRYSASFILRQDLSPLYMMSNTANDGTTTIIYDIPGIKKSYYDSIDKIDFESAVIQEFLSSMDLKDYRMMTDFTNLKFCSTTGKMNNMLLNKNNKLAVKDMGLTSIPTSLTTGDRYIISGNEGGTWTGHRDDIAICTDSTASTWTFIMPNANDITYVQSKSSNYIYTQYGWKIPQYDIPLQISIELFRILDSSITDVSLVYNIQAALVSAFSSRFGPNLTIYRTEIIEVIQGVTGVSHCRLIEPESSVFFNFDLLDFTEQQLLEYGPEWVYFEIDDITIKVLPAE
jgi:hypothetical protein